MPPSDRLVEYRHGTCHHPRLGRLSGVHHAAGVEDRGPLRSQATVSDARCIGRRLLEALRKVLPPEADAAGRFVSKSEIERERRVWNGHKLKAWMPAAQESEATDSAQGDSDLQIHRPGEGLTLRRGSACHNRQSPNAGWSRRALRMRVS